MTKTFIIDGVEYCIVRNPYTNGPMLARMDGLQIDNRKEICRRFLRLHGWTDEMFVGKITNYLEAQINRILNNGVVPGEKIKETLSRGSCLRKTTRSKAKESINSVIVVRMYAGGYLDENIGHEIINTFKTDSDRHFIYVSPWGMVSKEYADSNYVLLVRGISADVWEVIGYATQLEMLLSDDAINDGRHRQIDLIDSDLQLKLIQERGISFGGIPISEILSEQKQVVYVTYETKEYHSVKKDKQLYLVAKQELVQGDNYIYLPTAKNRFGTQSLHMYMDEKRLNEAYNKLLELFNDSDWWDDDLCHKIDNLESYDESFNILDVIRRNEDELTFSNWLAYYLANDQTILKDFCSEILNVQIDAETAIIKREFENIDIWIEDENNIIVIENKIKSGINGVVEERHDFSSDGIKSQLSKYVSIAEKEANGRKTTFKLLIPDYGVKDDELSVFKEYDRYLPVARYSDLLRFLENHTTSLPYYEDFKRAVKKHSTPYKKNLYQIMEERLIGRIKSKRLKNDKQ